MSGNGSNINEGESHLSPGEVFMQRRAQAAAESAKRLGGTGNGAGDGDGGSSSSGKKSLLEIQAEQAREQQQQQSGGGGGNGGRSRNNGGGGGPSFRGGGSNHSSPPPPRRSGSNLGQRRGGGGGAGAGNGGGYRSRGGQQQQQQQRYNSLPLEQGAVVSLKDSFGFIRCADRPDELFFHFSEVQGCHPSDLQINDEVEFRVGNSPTRRDGGGGYGNDGGDEPQKLAALQVQTLQPGTIAWEFEQEPGRRYRGLVERPVRSTDRSTSSAGLDGTIRVLVESGGEEAQEANKDSDVGQDGVDDGQKNDAAEDSENRDGDRATVTATASGPLVRFTASDYDPSDENGKGSSSGGASQRRPNRLARGDLVEFTIVVDRRSKNKFARSIWLVLSERERAKEEEERRMLEEATLERGVVSALKGDYGFLMSTRRREEVYFHYSHVELNEGCDSNGNAGDLDGGGASGELVLKEGQEMEFLVVTESTDSPGGSTKQQRRISARKVKMLPAGSVKFHDVIATGMTGKVAECPQPIDSGHALDQQGIIHLCPPLRHLTEDGEEEEITDVYLRSKDSPGGNFSFRGGASIGLYIQQGDTLLFDVVRDLMDGACRAVPTKYLVPRENPSQVGDEDVSADVDDKDKRIHLVALSWAMRSEGIVNAVKESYGFIHFAERPVDVHFKLYQVLPDELQADLRRNMGLGDFDDKGEPLCLSVGAEVHFDLSVHGTIHSAGHTGRHHHRGRNNAQPSHERENLKAQRVLFLPPGTIEQNKVLALDVPGTVSKADTKQPYSGAVDLETSVKTMTVEERHPLVVKMIDSYMESDQKTPLEFYDIQTTREEDVLIELLELKGKGKLAWSHIPLDWDPSSIGRFCIKKTFGEASEGKQEEQGVAEADDKHHESDDDLNTCVESKNGPGSMKSPSKKRKHTKIKTFKSVRFEKPGLVPELKEGLPPVVGDKVRLDIVQSRRTGQVLVENMRIVERAVVEVTETETSAVGIVKEVVPSRNFGFILVLDENASKRELIHFQLSSVTPSPDRPTKPSPKKKGGHPLIRKGDEVKFDVSTENGKRVALNVTLLPKNTIPNKAEKNACRGLVLLGPSSSSRKDASHSSSKNSPLRHTNSTISQQSDKSNQPGRWDSFEEDRKAGAAAPAESITEQGCILLVGDPGHVFVRGPSAKKKDHNGVEDSASAEANESSDTAKDISLGNGSSGEEPEGAASLPVHLRYKNGALAIHGHGSSSATDDSSNPRRGDLVSFGKVKSGKGLRDIRIVTRGAASLLRGSLENISFDKGNAKFVPANDKTKTYDVSLSEIISCDPSMVKEKEQVEGVLHEGRLYGICRTADLYLNSKLGTCHKERPKLNLTVKKDRGGTIMAQSMMAKGPDGTTGFHSGWTKRLSRYAPVFQPQNLPSPPPSG